MGYIESTLLGSGLGKISGKDAAELREYFAPRVIGECKSSTQVAIERLQTYGQPLSACEKCGGDRQARVAGTGFIASRRAKAKARKQASLEYKAKGLPAPMADMVCPNCGGLGWTDKGPRPRQGRRITARPKGSSRTVNVAEPNIGDFGDFVAYRRVSRRLEDVRLRSPLAAAVLSAYYDGGEECLLRVWTFTEAGQKLLERSAVSVRKNPRRVFEGEIRQQEAAPHLERQALLERAAREASRLVELAHALWNIAGGAPPPPRRGLRLVKNAA